MTLRLDESAFLRSAAAVAAAAVGEYAAYVSVLRRLLFLCRLLSVALQTQETHTRWLLFIRWGVRWQSADGGPCDVECVLFYTDLRTCYYT